MFSNCKTSLVSWKEIFFFFELHAPITSLCQHYCGSTLLRASLQFTRQKYRDQNNTKFNPEKGKMKWQNSNEIHSGSCGVTR